MYEWRIFSETDLKDQLPDNLDFFVNEFEHRSDVYYDFGSSEFGLKERIGDYTAKLELKVRINIDEYGAEYWTKAVCREFPHQEGKSLPFYQIEDIIEDEQKTNIYHRSYIEKFQQILDKDYIITNVYKKRDKFSIVHNGHLVNVEYVEGSVNGKTFYGFTLESEENSVIHELIETWNLLHLIPSTGYPGFIAKINATIMDTIYV